MRPKLQDKSKRMTMISKILIFHSIKFQSLLLPWTNHKLRNNPRKLLRFKLLLKSLLQKDSSQNVRKSLRKKEIKWFMMQRENTITTSLRISLSLDLNNLILPKRVLKNTLSTSKIHTMFNFWLLQWWIAPMNWTFWFQIWKWSSTNFSVPLCQLRKSVRVEIMEIIF
jgi:hypothetical protein